MVVAGPLHIKDGCTDAWDHFPPLPALDRMRAVGSMWMRLVCARVLLSRVRRRLLISAVCGTGAHRKTLP